MAPAFYQTYGFFCLLSEGLVSTYLFDLVQFRKCSRCKGELKELVPTASA